MWGSILTLLKFAGVLVSGAAAIFASTPDKTSASRTKSLPTSRFARSLRSVFSKQSALRWAIFGFVVALLSQFVETLKTNTEATEAQHKEQLARLNTSNQVWIAQKSLDSLERMVTRFDTISVSIKYQLDPQCGVYDPLYNLLSSIAPVNPPPQDTNKSPLVGYWNVPAANRNSIRLEIAQARDNRTFAVFGLNGDTIRSLIGANTNSLNSEAFQFTYRPSFVIKLFSASRTYCVVTPALQARLQAKIMRAFQSLVTNRIAASKPIEFNKWDGREPDLLLLITNPVTSPQITYDYVDKQIVMTCAFDCPRTNWQSQTERMSSLPDLAQSGFFISPAPSNVMGIRFVSADIKFDLTTITLTNCERFGGSWFTTRLPRKSKILSYE